MQNKLTEATVVGTCDRAAAAVGSKVRVGPRQEAKTQAKPEIHVHKQGDRIESIIITCACGEQVTVFCDYKETGQ